MELNDFSNCIERMKKKLYKTAFLYLGDEHKALDAVGETVYRSLKSLKKLRQPEYFDTWITRILINECKKELKRSKRVHGTDDLSIVAISENYSYDSLPLKEAIRKLPNELKEVVILRYFLGFTLQEVAESLCIPQGTVASRQRRALGLLKLELSGEELL